MYFGYQKDPLTGKVTSFKSPEPPTTINDKPIPTIMLVSLTDEEKHLSLDALIRMYPAP
jgi:hypothetical protein